VRCIRLHVVVDRSSVRVFGPWRTKEVSKESVRAVVPVRFLSSVELLEFRVDPRKRAWSTRALALDPEDGKSVMDALGWGQYELVHLKTGDAVQSDDIWLIGSVGWCRIEPCVGRE